MTPKAKRATKIMGRIRKNISVEDEDGKALEVLFGALAMQNWGIRLVLDKEKLDMTHYPKEFVEF